MSNWPFTQRVGGVELFVLFPSPSPPLKALPPNPGIFLLALTPSPNPLSWLFISPQFPSPFLSPYNLSRPITYFCFCLAPVPLPSPPSDCFVSSISQLPFCLVPPPLASPPPYSLGLFSCLLFCLAPIPWLSTARYSLALFSQLLFRPTLIFQPSPLYSWVSRDVTSFA